MLRIFFGRDRREIARLKQEVSDLRRERADLHYALRGGTIAQVENPEFMEWIADRLVEVHGESPVVDYVQTLRGRARVIRAVRDRWVRKADG